MDEYPPHERRSLTEEKVLLMIANAMAAQTASMEERIVKAMDDNFDRRFKELDARIDSVHDVFTKHVDEAFPDGPLTGHKLDHEGRMRWAETKQKLGVDVLRYVIFGAVGFAFLLLGLGAMEWIKQGMRT